MTNKYFYSKVVVVKLVVATLLKVAKFQKESEKFDFQNFNLFLRFKQAKSRSFNKYFLHIRVSRLFEFREIKKKLFVSAIKNV